MSVKDKDLVVEFQVNEAAEEVDERVGIVRSDHALLAVASAKTSTQRVRELIEEYFKRSIELRLDTMDIDTLVEMHAERAIEKAIANAITNGWGDGHTVEKAIDRKLRELVSTRVIKDLEVEVHVSIKQRGQ